MKKEQQLVFLVLALFAPVTVAFGQTAPQRSEELCSALKQSAENAGNTFAVTKPGACRMRLDNAYALFVDYSAQTLHIGMTFNPAILQGDASAFWLRLSALDNLVETALHTKPRVVFDELNRLVVKELAPYLMKHNAVPDKMLHAQTDKVTLGVNMNPDTAIIALIASAGVNDIDRMQQARRRAATGGVATWRKILGLSLQAFAAGAKGYADGLASQPSQTVVNSRRTCFTNFIGNTVVTNCY
jgi:hypothetical protein